jgi:hypothetical protein
VSSNAVGEQEEVLVVLISSRNPNRLKQRDNVGTNDPDFLLHEVGRGCNHKMVKLYSLP